MVWPQALADTVAADEHKVACEMYGVKASALAVTFTTTAEARWPIPGFTPESASLRFRLILSSIFAPRPFRIGHKAFGPKPTKKPNQALRWFVLVLIEIMTWQGFQSLKITFEEPEKVDVQEIRAVIDEGFLPSCDDRLETKLLDRRCHKQRQQ